MIILYAQKFDLGPQGSSISSEYKWSVVFTVILK